MNQSTSIIEIKGIGEKTAALFQKLNIETVGICCFHYPRTYVQFPVAKEVAEVTDGETAAVPRQGEKDTRCETHEKHAGHGDDHRHGMRRNLNWCGFGCHTSKASLHRAIPMYFYGKVARKGSRLVMEQAAIYSGEAYAAMEQAFCRCMA